MRNTCILKRLLCLLLMAVLVAGVFPAGSIKAAETETNAASGNLLKNGKASQGLKNWKVKTGAWQATDSVSEIDPYDGEFFYPGECEEAELYQDVSLKSFSTGAELTLSAKVRGWTDSDTGGIRLTFLNKKGKELAAFQKDYADSEWKTKTVIARIPKGAVKVRVSLVAVKHSGSSCDVYFDNLVLKKTKGKNLLQNGSAEYGTAGWVDEEQQWGIERLPSTDHEPKDGDSFFWPCGGATEHALMYQDVEIASSKAGKWITLSAWVANFEQAPHDESVLSLTFLNSKGKTISTYSQSQRNPEWQKHIIKAKIPKGTKTVRVTLEGNRYVGAELDSYFDDVRLTIESKSYKSVKIKAKQSGAAKVGGKKTLVASYGSVTAASKFTWTSSYDDIATVSKKGVVKFLKPGQVTIYATYKKTKVTGSITFDVQE